MPRTTDALVQEVIEVDTVGVPSLTPFITAAHMMLNSVVPEELRVEENLTIAETWLAAHFYAVRDKQVASEAAGPVSASYQYKVDLNLASTMYGQQAMLLEMTGKLADWNREVGAKPEPVKAKKAFAAFWLGKE